MRGHKVQVCCYVSCEGCLDSRPQAVVGCFSWSFGFLDGEFWEDELPSFEGHCHSVVIYLFHTLALHPTPPAFFIFWKPPFLATLSMHTHSRHPRLPP